MGIGFIFCDAQWSYSGYHRFRNKLAHAVGIELDEMIGYGGNKEWPSPEEEPLVILLDSPDNGGEFSPDECALMVRRLKDLLEILKNEEDDHDYKNGKALLRGMRQAIQRKHSLAYF